MTAPFTVQRVVAGTPAGHEHTFAAQVPVKLQAPPCVAQTGAEGEPLYEDAQATLEQEPGAEAVAEPVHAYGAALTLQVFAVQVGPAVLLHADPLHVLTTEPEKPKVLHVRVQVPPLAVAPEQDVVNAVEPEPPFGMAGQTRLAQIGPAEVDHTLAVHVLMTLPA